MMEFVFVIVVAAILSISLIPNFERDNAGEAAYQLARHLRLTQHLALMEDRVNDPDAARWKATLWRMSFYSPSGKECYMVYADRDANGGNPGADERAIDPLTKRYVWGNTTCDGTNPEVNDDVLLTKSFAVSAVTVCGGNGAKHIAFDNLGRPGRVSLSGGNGTFTPLTSTCVISISTSNSHTAEVSVFPETGFVKVTKIDNTVL